MNYAAENWGQFFQVFVLNKCSVSFRCLPARHNDPFRRRDDFQKMQNQDDRSLKHFYQASSNNYSDCITDCRLNRNRLAVVENARMDLLNKTSKTKGSTVYHKLKNVSDDAGGEMTSVEPIQPKTCCSRRSCILLIVWLLLFITGVLLLTVFVLRVIQKGARSTVDRPFYSNYIELEKAYEKKTIVPCDDVIVNEVWHSDFDKLQTETAVRFVDVNSDGIADPIIAFGTGVDGYNVEKIVCQIHFNGTYPCFGGALALDGRNGQELWRHYSGHEIYAVNCNGDINKDGIPDCLLGGRGGIFDAVSGKDGQLLWGFWDAAARSDVMNLYTAQFIKDLNNDGVMEVLQIHGGDPLAYVLLFIC